MSTFPSRSFARALPLLVAFTTATACDSATEPGVATHIEAASSTTITGTVATNVTPVPTVRITDQNHNPAPGIDVFFWTAGPGGIPVNTASRTGANGEATVGAWLLGTHAGAQTLRAQLTGGPSVVFTALATAATPASIIALDTIQSSLAGSVLSLRVRIADAFGNPVKGTLVTFKVDAGGGSVSKGSAYTDSIGIARTQWTVGAGGSNSVVAASAGLEDLRFTSNVVKAELYYELETMFGWITPPTGWITLDGSSFTTSVNGITGSGTYTTSGSAMIFTYSTDFLTIMGKATEWWPSPYSLQQEKASISAELITIMRCYGEDCYDHDWTYRRKTR